MLGSALYTELYRIGAICELRIAFIQFLFLQVLSPCTDEEAHLHPPALTKQFLISPPTSPPVGWEQPREDRPVVDYDLLAAMASLAPGEDCTYSLWLVGSAFNHRQYFTNRKNIR